MSRIWLPFFILLILAGPAAAQSKPDEHRGRGSIVGNWVIDSKKSSSSGPGIKNEKLEITYQEPELKIERTLTLKKETKSATFILFTDKRGETTKPFPFNPEMELSSTTEWQGNVLVRTFVASQVGNPRNTLTLTERYETRDDGRMLVVTTRNIPSAGGTLDPTMLPGMATKRVYRRVD